MSYGFQQTLGQIRADASSARKTGALFERLMKQYLRQDPLYTDRFSDVWLWSEWAADRADFTGHDTGVDLVAEEHGGGYCAIRCKFTTRGPASQRALSTPSAPPRRGIRSRRAWSSIPATRGDRTL